MFGLFVICAQKYVIIRKKKRQIDCKNNFLYGIKERFMQNRYFPMFLIGIILSLKLKTFIQTVYLCNIGEEM